MPSAAGSSQPTSSPLEALPAWFPNSLFPVRSRVVPINGAQVHFVDEGTGPTLLLLHGNPTWSFLYRHLIRLLSADYRCVAPDLPGFGLSKPAPGYDFRPESHAGMLRQFVRALGLRDVTMMVQDWSGPIGLAVAVAEPARFRALVIGNTFAWSGKGDPHYERFSSVMGGKVAGFLNRQFNFFPRFVIRSGVKSRRLTREEMQAYLDPFAEADSREPMRIFAREIIGSSEFLDYVERGISKISSMPALIVWGDRDFAFREQERKRFENCFPNHRTVLLPGAGHFIQEDSAQEIALAIKDWLGVASDHGSSPQCVRRH